MAQLLPPPPPIAVLGNDDSRERLQFRLWQMLMSTLTVLVAVWFTTMGPLSAILAWVVAKHILVAILMMGLHRFPNREDEAEPPGAKA